MTASNLPAVAGSAGLPAEYDYGADAGAGFENQTSADYKIPFLNLLQALSPQVQAEGSSAKAGMLHNSVTNELIAGSTGFGFVPCLTEHVFVEWRPKTAGGGIVAIHQLDSAEAAAAKKFRKDNPNAKGAPKNSAGNDIVETFYVYGIAELNGSVLPMIITFASTKIKKYSAWMTRARTFQVVVGDRKINPPLFALKWIIKSTKERNKRNEEYYNYQIDAATEPLVNGLLLQTSDLYTAARDLRDAVKSGLRRGDTDSLKSASEGDAAGDQDDGADGTVVDGEKPPF